MSINNKLVGITTSEIENAMNAMEMCGKDRVELWCYLKELAGQNPLGWFDTKGPTIGDYEDNNLQIFCIQNDEGNVNGFILCGDHRFFVGAFPTIAEAEKATEKAVEKELADVRALKAIIKGATVVEKAATQSSGKKVHKDALIKRINKILEPRKQKLHHTREKYVERFGQYHIQDDVLDMKIGNINLIAIGITTKALAWDEAIVY